MIPPSVDLRDQLVGGYERVWDLVSSLILTRCPLDSGDQQLHEAMQNILLDLPGPRSIPAKKEPGDKFIGSLLTGVIEINKAYLTIQDVREYFRRCPRGIPGNQKSQYLAFTIHAYLNEVYILEQRLQAYPTKLARAAAKGSEVRTNVEKIGPRLNLIVATSFDQIRTARGVHVHHQRFSDPGIDSLSTLEFVSRDEKLPLYESLRRRQIRRVRRHWDERFVANQRAIKTLLDTYYESLLNAVAHPNGQFKRFL